MSDAKVEFCNREDSPSLSKGIDLFIEFFQINNISGPDSLSIVSNFILIGFINLDDDEDFEQYLNSLKMAYEMNKEKKNGRKAKKPIC